MGIQMMGGNPLESFQTGYNLGNKPNAIGTAILGVMDRYQQKQLMDEQLGQKKALAQWELENITKPQKKYESTLEAQSLEGQLKQAQINYLTGGGGGSPNPFQPAKSQDEALKQIPQGDNPKDYLVKPKTVMVKGIPVNTYNAEYDPKLKESRVANERQTQFIKDSAQDNLNTIAEIKNGMSNFGAMGGLPSTPWDYDRKNWESNVNKLLSGKVVELITTMKSASKTGATGFGQLSEREGQLLREASTALNRGLSPQDANKYLTQMETILQRVVSGDGQINQVEGQEDFSTMSDDELRAIAGGQ